MGFKMAKVRAGGLADELGLRKGDELLEINSETFINLIDYQQLMSCENIVLRFPPHTARSQSRMRQGYGRGTGRGLRGRHAGQHATVRRQVPVLLRRPASPKDMRSSLYVKDDDWRMRL